MLSGAVIDTRHPDYTGTGFVDFADTAASGGYIQWTVSVPTAGTRTLTFRYANGGAANRPLAISVNGTGVNGALPFNPTGSWDTWGTTSFTASLPAGSQIAVRATTTGANGANIDSLTITYAPDATGRAGFRGHAGPGATARRYPPPGSGSRRRNGLRRSDGNPPRSDRWPQTWRRSGGADLKTLVHAGRARLRRIGQWGGGRGTSGDERCR